MQQKIYTKQAPKAIGPYSQAILVNNFIFTSGQIGINPATNNIEADTIEAQTEQVMQNLQAILTEAGSSFEKTVKTTCYLINMDDFTVFNEIYAKYFTNKPARSCIAAKELPKGALIEVEVIATL